MLKKEDQVVKYRKTSLTLKNGIFYTYSIAPYFEKSREKNKCVSYSAVNSLIIYTVDKVDLFWRVYHYKSVKRAIIGIFFFNSIKPPQKKHLLVGFLSGFYWGFLGGFLAGFFHANPVFSCNHYFSRKRIKIFNEHWF